jgi:hypothetical protein
VGITHPAFLTRNAAAADSRRTPSHAGLWFHLVRIADFWASHFIYYSRCNFSRKSGGTIHCFDLKYPAWCVLALLEHANRTKTKE